MDKLEDIADTLSELFALIIVYSNDNEALVALFPEAAKAAEKEECDIDKIYSAKAEIKKYGVGFLLRGLYEMAPHRGVCDLLQNIEHPAVGDWLVDVEGFIFDPDKD